MIQLEYLRPRICRASGVYHDEGKEVADFDLVILRTSDGGQSWRACYEYHKTGEPSQIEKRIWRLATLSEKIAVAVIDGNSLLRTEDGGTTWRAVGPTAEGGFYSVSFSSNGTGWAVGQRGAFAQSIDGGRTWHKVTDLPGKLSNQDWWSIDFADGALRQEGNVYRFHRSTGRPPSGPCLCPNLLYESWKADMTLLTEGCILRNRPL